MTTTKRHLVIRTSGRTACGLRRADYTTADTALVTCGSCQRTEQMALAELRARQTPRERRRRRNT